MAKKWLFFGFFDPYFDPPKNPIFWGFFGFFWGFPTPRKNPPPKPPIRGLRDSPPRPDRGSRVSHLLTLVVLWLKPQQQKISQNRKDNYFFSEIIFLFSKIHDRFFYFSRLDEKNHLFTTDGRLLSLLPAVERLYRVNV